MTERFLKPKKSIDLENLARIVGCQDPTDDQDVATKKFVVDNSIYIEPSTSLSHKVLTVVQEGTGFEFKLSVPTYTSTERNALTNVPDKLIIYNSTLGSFQQYQTSSWVSIGGGSGGAVSWGDILGDILDQSDLQTALSAKYDASNPDNFVNASEAAAAAPVQSVNNKTGIVVIDATDVGLGNVPNVDATDPTNITQSASYRFVTDTEKSTWNGKQDALPTGVATEYLNGEGNLVTPKLDELDDTAIDTPVDGQILKYNGIKWINDNFTVTVGAGSGITYFLGSTSSGIGSYDLMAQVPDSAAEAVESASLNNNTVLIDGYISTDAINKTTIPAGIWEFNTYAYVSSPSGTTSIKIEVYKRTSGGTETLLFEVNTDQINSNSTSLYSVSTAQQEFTINTTDKLVVKYYGVATGIVTVYLVHSGTENYSHFHTPLVTGHNDLNGIQGGSSTERYHLTQAEAAAATRNASGSQSGLLSSTDWSTFNNKQSALGFTPENVSNKAIDFTTVNDTKYPTVKAVNDQLATKQDSLTNSNFGSFVSSLIAKNTPIDGDQLPLIDSAAANVGKKLSWSNIKSTLKTYFDSLYQNALTNPVTSSSGTPSANQLAVFNATGTQVAPTTTLPTAATPAYTGDVTKPAGSLSTTIANNAVTTVKINNSAVTLAKIQNATANSKLLGSGASGSSAAYSEITLGTNLSMSGTTLNAASVPTGAIVYAPESMNSAMVSAGYLACDGSILTQSSYAALYAAIGLIDDRGTNFNNSAYIGVNANVQCILSNGTRVIAVANNTVYYASVSDPTSWTAGATVTGATTGIYVPNAGWQKFFLIGSAGQIYVSSDGITWATKTSGTTQTLWDICWNGFNLVVSGNNGVILTNSDGNGDTWITRTTGTTANLRWLAANPSNGTVVCKIATTAFTTAVLLVSTDGSAASWSPVTFPIRSVSGGSLVYGLYNGSSAFVLKFTNLAATTLWTSTNGTSWTLRDSARSFLIGTNETNNSSSKVFWNSSLSRYYSANNNLHGMFYSFDTLVWKAGFSPLGNASISLSMFMDSTNAYVGFANGIIYYAPLTYSYNTSTQFKLPKLDINAQVSSQLGNIIGYIKT